MIKMSSFVSIMKYTIAIVLAVPIVTFMFASLGGGFEEYPDLSAAFDRYDLPNMEQYATTSDSPLDAAVAVPIMVLNGIIWIFEMILNTTHVIPTVMVASGVPAIIITPISIMIGVSMMFLIYKVVRGQDLEE